MAQCTSPDHAISRYALMDARGIFVAYVCPVCVESVKAGYREDIFTDPDYWTDEPVEPD